MKPRDSKSLGVAAAEELTAQRRASVATLAVLSEALKLHGLPPEATLAKIFAADPDVRALALSGLAAFARQNRKAITAAVSPKRAKAGRPAGSSYAVDTEIFEAIKDYTNHGTTVKAGARHVAKALAEISQPDLKRFVEHKVFSNVTGDKPAALRSRYNREKARRARKP